ncbi:winged helix-turn-helix domain-containing protein [Bacillus timonensis]|nr:winged helix-turn-helix domain-containing protein [Bacillus timonensis]
MTSQINYWKTREGLMSESVWLSKGISLYKLLLQEHPDNIEAKTELAKLLVRSGTDEKMKYVNLLKAKELFEEVIALFPHNAEALYRLGHISFEEHEYEKSIKYFEEAVELPLSDIRMFRAYSTISKAHFQQRNFEESLSFLNLAKEVDTERNFTLEVSELESLINQDGVRKRLIRYSDGVSDFLTVEQSEQEKSETALNDEAELDLSHFHPTFTGPAGEERLERKEAEILSYLIERDTRYISKEELLVIWDEDEQPEVNTIKSYISKIKTKLRRCFSEDVETISTKRGHGYKWTCEVPTKIMKIL